VGFGIAVDAGSAYVTGGTSSTTPTAFPTTLGAFDTDYNGGTFDAFVTSSTRSVRRAAAPTTAVTTTKTTTGSKTGMNGSSAPCSARWTPMATASVTATTTPTATTRTRTRTTDPPHQRIEEGRGNRPSSR
jgi:hypothetical protein